MHPQFDNEKLISYLNYFIKKLNNKSPQNKIANNFFIEVFHDAFYNNLISMGPIYLKKIP